MIGAMILLVNVLLIVAMNGAGNALRDWGAAYSRKQLSRRASSPSTT